MVMYAIINMVMYATIQGVHYCEGQTFKVCSGSLGESFEIGNHWAEMQINGTANV